MSSMHSAFVEGKPEPQSDGSTVVHLKLDDATLNVRVKDGKVLGDASITNDNQQQHH